MGLLQSLFGGGHQMSPPPGHKWSYDSQGNLVPTPIDQMPQSPQASDPQAPAPQAQAPMPAPAAAPDPNATQPAPAVNNDAITVTGQRPDNWKPHNAGVLGQISDYLLGTHFGRENESRNLSGAMEHISTNPMEAMRRVMQVDPKLGVELYEKFTDDKRQQGSLDRQNNIYDLMADKYVNGIVGGMANASTADNWPTMRTQIIKFGQKYHKDFSGLSDTYDPDIATSLAEGVIPAAKQQQLKQNVTKESDLDRYRTGTLGIRQQNADTARGQLDVSRAGLGVRQQNANTEAGGLNERVRNDNLEHGDRVTTASNRQPPMRASSGMSPMGAWVTNKDGTQLFLKNKDDGKTYRYINIGNDGKGHRKWHPAGVVDDTTAASAASN